MGGSDATATVIAVAASACLPDAKPGQCLRHTVASSLRVLVERRKALVCKYPITGAEFPCLEEHSAESVADVWGSPANPVDSALHRKAMLRVWRRTMKARINMTTKEALADKEYRKRGGKFVFPSPMDTFIRGLHRRTADLHTDWRQRLQRDTSGDEVRAEAVAEMLPRLRWDDSDTRARAKLSHIVARIWDGLEGKDLTGMPPLSSALWHEDIDDFVSNTQSLPEAVALDAEVTSSIVRADLSITKSSGVEASGAIDEQTSNMALAKDEHTILAGETQAAMAVAATSCYPMGAEAARVSHG